MDLTTRGLARMSIPLMRAMPLSGNRIPSRISTVVVLPAPLGPRMPKTSPRLTAKDTLSTARMVP